jgi:hypothetical protein
VGFMFSGIVYSTRKSKLGTLNCERRCPAHL